LDNLVSTKIKENDYFSKHLYDDQGNRLNNETLTQNIEANDLLNKKSSFLYDQLVGVFINSDFYDRLKVIVNDENKVEFINAYINDYLLLSLNEPFINFTHFKIFQNRLITYCKKIFCKSSNDLNMLIGIHLSLDELKQELQLFTKFGLLCDKVIDIIDKSEDYSSNLCFLASR
jgi:hypothetical protein